MSMQQPWGFGKPVVPQSGMLASDAARERVVQVLNQAFTEGRLLPEEHSDRIGRAYSARTYGELDALTVDIPQRVPPRPPAPGTNGKAVASVICGATGMFFLVPALPAIVLGHVARHEIRRTGEQGDGMAVAGLVMGYAVTVFMALIFFSAMVAATAGS